MSKKVFYSIIFLSATLTLALISLVDQKYLGIGQYLASSAEEGRVEASAKVSANPINILFKRLKERKLALNNREAKLETNASEFKEKLETQTKLAIILASFSGISLILVLLNFYLDGKRRKWEELRHKKDETQT
jgi:hypothetical protein